MRAPFLQERGAVCGNICNLPILVFLVFDIARTTDSLTTKVEAYRVRHLIFLFICDRSSENGASERLSKVWRGSLVLSRAALRSRRALLPRNKKENIIRPFRTG